MQRRSDQMIRRPGCWLLALLALGAATAVDMPADVRALLARLTFMVSFGIGGVATTPLECLGLAGYVPRLIFWVALPIVITVVILVAVCFRMCLKKKKKPMAVAQRKVDDEAHMGQTLSLGGDAQSDGPEVGSTVVENVLPPFLQVMFILYPLVTNVAFEGFPCYSFEGGRGWLIADVSIECNTPDHDSATALAWVAVIVYPVGLMVGNLFLLFLARNAIIDGKETPLSRSIAFLYREYGKWGTARSRSRNIRRMCTWVVPILEIGPAL